MAIPKMASRGRGLVLDRLLAKSSKLQSPSPQDQSQSSQRKDESLNLSGAASLAQKDEAGNLQDATNSPISQLLLLSSPGASLSGIGRGSTMHVEKLMTPEQFMKAKPKSPAPPVCEDIAIDEQFKEDTEHRPSDHEDQSEDVCPTEDECPDGASYTSDVGDDVQIVVDDKTEDITMPSHSMENDKADSLEAASHDGDDELQETKVTSEEAPSPQEGHKPFEKASENVTPLTPVTAERIARVAPTVGQVATPRGVPSVEHQQAENEWNKLKLERKVKKLISGISDETLDNAMKELPFLLKDKSFGNENHNCSVMLTILFDKATQLVAVVPYVACLLKHLADNHYTSIKLTLPSVINDLSKSLVKVVKSDKPISDATERLCNILGTLFTFPVIYHESFHSLILPLVANCVDAWTYTRVMKVSMSGHRLDVALVHTYALGHLLRRIALRLRDDKKPLAEMEGFVESVRLSALNESLPRQLRSVYLDILLAEANEWPDDMFPSVTIDIHAPLNLPCELESVAERTDAASAKDEKPKASTGQETAMPAAVSMETLPRYSYAAVASSAKTDALRGLPAASDVNQDASEVIPSDPYAEITVMLTDLKLLTELERFKSNVIRDVSLRSHPDSVRGLLKEAEFPPGLSREVLWYLKNKGITKEPSTRSTGNAYRTPRGPSSGAFRGRQHNPPSHRSTATTNWRQGSPSRASEKEHGSEAQD